MLPITSVKIIYEKLFWEVIYWPRLYYNDIFSCQEIDAEFGSLVNSSQHEGGDAFKKKTGGNKMVWCDKKNWTAQNISVIGWYHNKISILQYKRWYYNRCYRYDKWYIRWYYNWTYILQFKTIVICSFCVDNIAVYLKTV